MKKLALNPDHLRVESFESMPADTGRGTVAAREVSYPVWDCKTTDGITQPATMCNTCHSGPIQCF